MFPSYAFLPSSGVVSTAFNHTGKRTIVNVAAKRWMAPRCTSQQLPSLRMSSSLPRVQRSENTPNDDSKYSSFSRSESFPLPSSVFESLSKATIIGRTGTTPEIKDLPSGVRCAKLRVATNHLAGSGASQRVATQWHYIQVYDSVVGFNLICSLPVGTQVYIEGDLRITNSERDGETRQYTTISLSKSQGIFRILRRPYRSGDNDSDNENQASQDNFPF